MVLGRNDKRKRKEGDLVDLMDPASSAPKRAKVHAQRKFAQGVATIFSPGPTLVKEKERPKPALVTELITHKRPNTEDFLTFLCFRGTSILPPSLNFFNQSTKKEKSETKTSRSTSQPSSQRSLPGSSKPNEESPKKSLSTPKTAPQSSSTVSPQTKAKKKLSNVSQNPNIVHKPSNKFKTATSTVQALKKKYKEQRLAKQRIENKIKKTVMKTRSATNRPLLKQSTKIIPSTLVKHIEKKNLSLRSGAVLDRCSPKTPKLLPKTRKKPIKKKIEESESSEESSDAQSTPKRVVKPKSNVKQTPKEKLKTNSLKSKDSGRRVTRSHGEPSQPNQRPSRKTKEAAAVYMEILSRKLVNEDLDNDDNMSLESFPEIPNAKRDATAKKLVTDKKRNVGTKKVNEVEEKSSQKLVRSKRIVKQSKYSDSDDNYSIESDRSSRTPLNVKTRELPRRSANLTKAASRNLRSTVKNVDQKIDKLAKAAKQTASNVKDKRGIKVKRKNDDESSKANPLVKPNEKGQKLLKKKMEEESEEEPLGIVLTRINKAKPTKSPGRRPGKATEPSKKSAPEPVIMIKKINKDTENTPKGSDDEGSFRGFSKISTTNLPSICALKMNSDDMNPGKNGETEAKIETKDCEVPELDGKTAAPQKSPKNEAESGSLVKPAEIVVKEFVQGSKRKSISSEVPAPQSIDKRNFIDVPTLSSLGRKERVNMSTEQIEKWLTESSMVKEESKAEMETAINYPYALEVEKPKITLPVPVVSTIESSNSDTVPPVVSIPNTPNLPNPPNIPIIPSQRHLSIPTRIQHLVRPVNVAIAKIAEKQLQTTQTELNQSFSKQGKPDIILSSTGIATAKTTIPTNRNKINADIKEIIKGRTVKSPESSISDKSTQQIPKIDDEPDTNSVKVTSDIDKISTPSVSDKKKIPTQGRKPFVSKVKERKLSIPNSNAFSPEDESSVYAFKNETEAPLSTPFRRKFRDQKAESAGLKESPQKCESKSDQVSNQNSDVKTDKSESNPMTNDMSESPNPTVFKNLPTIWNDCSTSIAVQINFNESSESPGNPFFQLKNSQALIVDDKSKNLKASESTSNEISTQTESSSANEDDNTTQVFYIPLENVGRSMSHLTSLQGQPLIQGVAVKLGTEGPNGPNQRVLLRAQLVTKPPLTVTRCPPIGTVQPTTRTPQGSDPIPSTSSISSIPPKIGESRAASLGIQEEADKAKKPTVKAREGKKKTLAESKKAQDKDKRQDKRLKKPSTSSDVTSSSFSSSSSLQVPSVNSSLESEARLKDAPTFHPTEKDFQDPLEYIEKIRPLAEKFGICKVVPPSNFKPECKISDDMRFTAYNQYIHRMLHRWGPNVKEMMAIKKYLATQSITLSQPPWIGGMEVDLPHLYQTVQSLGGLKEVIEKKKWQKVADGMKIPKSAQDRVTKLDDIYCKYLLPYDTLSPEEREKLFEDVETEWRRREGKALQRLNGTVASLSSAESTEDEDEEDSSDEIEECIVKGRNMPLNAFYRIARNTQRMWFGENNVRNQGNESEASSSDVETAFWRHVAERKRHVCVHAASIDSSGRGFGFSVAKNSPFARHPWNLKVLTNNSGSVLRALGPLMGVTIPTIHVGMLFSACCWYRDPHGLPWIEYLHTGAKKIWYGIPNEYNDHFREALSKMVPRFCKNKKIWLPSDTAMVPPEMLASNGVPLCKIVQEPGQFIIVFPKAFTSSICTGYVVSESVYFAQTTWLGHAEEIFKDLQDSCEPSMFSFERLMFSIVNDTRSHLDILKQILPVMMNIREKELHNRQQLEYYGLPKKEKLPLPDNGKRKKGAKVKEDDGDFECETCRTNLFVSLVHNTQDDSTYCLPHALQVIGHKKQILKYCILKYTYSEDELDDLIHKLEDRIEAKSKKKPSKQSD